MTQRRLIEETFPLKKVSADSKHEKNVRHGHISTLHIWPARRPLAACRAALIAALMPDPGDEKGRAGLNKKIEAITHWGTENGPELDFFRREIRQAFGGRAPRVLDMFAGGGAIPLEAMRLGCDVTAIDYNPVAWFILKCTLEFPQRLAGKTWPLPMLNHEGHEEHEEKTRHQPRLLTDQGREGNLADHVRYWGEWVLARARAELAPYYPMVNGQPTVAYLWARTVPCPDPSCGAEVPLLKTLWLCKKDKKRRALRLVPPSVSVTLSASEESLHAGNETLRFAQGDIHSVVPTRVRFEIWNPGPHDDVPPGTMAGAKSQCPVCRVPVTTAYIKRCGHAGKLGTRLTAVVVHTPGGKEYRLPTPEEEAAAARAAEALPAAAAQIPYGLPTELLPGPETLGFRVPLYGFKTWADLFTPRQLLALVTFVKWTRAARAEIGRLGYPDEWAEAVGVYLALLTDKVADRNSSQCIWISTNAEKAAGTFGRFALPITWDFVEIFPWSQSAGGAPGSLDHIAEFVEHGLTASSESRSSSVVRQSATEPLGNQIDAIVTDPPYYDAIPYADLSDFFYVWLRRMLGDQYLGMFASSLTPKLGELVQQNRNDRDGRMGKAKYEEGMAQAFCRGCEALVSGGRMITVFAHKDPDAWETLVTAMMQAGFTVTASWPIDTERGGRMRAQSSAALASSIWLVCRKRAEGARVGRYAAVRRAMEERITERLRYFWDLGVSGPDFVWAAVGPALESYSAYDEVRRLDGTPFTVGEFLREVRRMVADFALGQILKGRSTEGLDEWTRYYLMHRNDFGLAAAPVGECILLSGGYGLDLNDLRGPRGLLVKASRVKADGEEEDGAKPSGSDVRLAKWDERKRDDLGEPHPDGGLPLIDMLHRLMGLWTSGDTVKLRAYVADRGLGQNDLFWAVAQAVLEMAEPKSKERTLLEVLVAWGRGKEPEQKRLL